MPRPFPLLWLSLLSGILVSVCSADSKTAFTLFETVRDRPGLVFAPAAMEEALSLLYFGSDGETETAFQSRLFPGLSRADAQTRAAGRNRAIPGYERTGGLWVDMRLSLSAEFKQAASQAWGLPVSRAPLQSDPMNSAAQINAWFSSETHGRESAVVTSADIPAGAELVGVTVATFVSPWKRDYFEPHDTQPDFFHFAPKSKSLVPMMKSSAAFFYGEDEQFQTLRLDYKHEGTALLLLLPKDASRFKETLAAFTSDSFAKAVAGLQSTQVQLWLPKIRYQSKIDWRKPLAQLGLAHAFSPRADFRRIQGDKSVPLSLTHLEQDVLIQWDEHGTEARAVTKFAAAFGAAPAPPKPPVQFIANHPFAYLIFNTTTLDIYFMGVVSEPSQMSPTS